MIIQTLTEAVRIATGIPDAEPRPGQKSLTEHIEQAINTTGQAVAVAPTGVGKALDIDTPIPTPNGWTRMGDLRDGDEVFDEEGKICNVVKAHAFQYDRPCYDVVFSDGSRITADGEHLWSVSTRAMRARACERVRSTVRYNSTRPYERLLKLEAVRENIAESGYMLTFSNAALLLKGLADGTTIGAARRSIGAARLAKGETFDLRPVLDEMIATARTRTILAKEAEPSNITLSTLDMTNSLRGQGNGVNYAVDVPGALQLPHRDDLELPPYVLGAWLGDGSSHCAHLTSENAEIPELIRSEGINVVKLSRKYLYSLHLGATPVNTAYAPNVTGLLRRLNLRKNKHIPTKYLRASFEQRLALLQGLMDTDGTVNRNGRCEIAVCSEQLADGIYELVCSLGIKATYNSGPAAITEADPDNPGKRRRRVVGIRYRIGFVTELQVFRLARKAGLLPTKKRDTQLRRYVVAIEPVASRPVRCILVDSPSHLFLAGPAMIPTHNTMALLAPAMVAAAEHGQRTIISTESLSLQAQIIDKDAPDAAAACERVTGKRPEVALLKGFGNYVCLAAVRDVAEALTGTVGQRLKPATLSTKLGKLRHRAATLDNRPFDTVNGIPVLQWALDLAEDEAGDKQSYEGVITNELWDLVSVGPSECISDTCPVFEYCKPRTARAKAAEADIVVTNHSMLAVQAAKGVPVIVGNKNLGEFHIIMIDEAHTLPANVRNAGASEVSAATVTGLTRSIGRVLDEMEPKVEQLMKEGMALAGELDGELAAIARGTRTGETFRLGEDADPLEATGEILIAWARSVKNALESSMKASDTKLRLKAKRLNGRLDTFIANIAAVKLHKVGTARWIVEKVPGKDAKNQTPYWAANASPVNIGPMLKANLWTAPVIPDEEDPMVQAMKEAGEPVDQETETYPMTVVAVSATLPKRFAYQVGMDVDNVAYPSPFDTAYGSSVLYVAKVEDHEIAQMYPGWRRGTRARFDTRLHQEWAARKNVELVDANLGAGLILSANSAAGKHYVEALRRAAGKRWKVHSQWDGLSTRQLISAWRDDEDSVLVGTRSLMTGVDAKGRTCSLVSIDRVPRAAGNPVDDARVEALMEALQTDKWAADRLVYATDAALLLEQAAGRLIRSVTDYGLVAILDPRFLKTGPVSYPEPTRLIYKDAVARFTKVVTRQADAEEYLHRISSPAALRMAA